MAFEQLASGPGRSRTAWRAGMAVSLALLVVGAGAALGMSGSGRPAATHQPVLGGLAAGPGGTGAASSVPGPPVPSSTDQATTSTTTLAVPGPGSLPVATGGTTSSGSGTPAPGSTAGPGASTGGGTPLTTVPAGTQAPGARVPAAGTYTYDTSGGQQISLLGSSTYPAQTSIVVTNQGCGVASTWKPSQGNSETVVECPVAGGLHIVSESSTVAANGYSTTQTFTCDADSFIPVGGGQVGQTWTWKCSSSNGETSTQVVKLLGPRTAAVGGIPVSAVEVSVASTLSGPEQGTMNSDYWLTSNGTPVKESGDTNASAGTLTYSSHYTLQLRSLTPTA